MQKGKRKPELRPREGEYLTDGVSELYRFEQYIGDEGVLVEDARTGTRDCWDIEDFTRRVSDGELAVVIFHCPDCGAACEPAHGGLWKCPECGTEV